VYIDRAEVSEFTLIPPLKGGSDFQRERGVPVGSLAKKKYGFQKRGEQRKTKGEVTLFLCK